MTVTMKVVNDKQVLQKLANLNKRTAKKVARKAVNAGGAVIVKAVRRNLKSGTTDRSGTLKRGLTKVTVTRKDGSGYESRIGAKRRKRDSKTNKFPAMLWHLVDQDTQAHGNHPGTRGKRFLEQSQRESEKPAVDAMKAKLKTEVIAEAKML